jgi:hypothetical protein
MSDQPSEYYKNIERMYGRQASWQQSARDGSSEGSSSTSPISPRHMSITSLKSTKGKGKARSDEGGAKASRIDGEAKGRKKVAKACLTCQKSHLTCDDGE